MNISPQKTVNEQSVLSNPALTVILFAVMVKRLGGNVHIRQADIDEIAYNRLDEDVWEDGSIEFKLVKKGHQQFS